MAFPNRTARKSEPFVPSTRPPIRYTYSHPENGDIIGASLHLDAHGETSYQTLSAMLTQIELCKSEIMMKFRRYIPWSSYRPRTPRRDEDSDGEDSSYGRSFEGMIP